MLQTVLLEGQQIKITFDDDHTILLRDITLGHREAVENLSFMIDTGLWRVKILGLSFSNHPSTESDDPLMEVENRKEDPASKSIVPTRRVQSPTFLRSRVPGFLFRKDQTQLPCQFKGNLLLPEMLDQTVPAVGRVSQPVLCNDLLMDPSFGNVLSTLLALSTLGEEIMKIV
jgi:hypothetical protein